MYFKKKEIDKKVKRQKKCIEWMNFHVTVKEEQSAVDAKE